MAFNYSGGPIPVPQGGGYYDPYSDYFYQGSTVNQSPFLGGPSTAAGANYRSSVYANSPFGQANQMQDFIMKLLPKVLSGTGMGMGGKGGPGNLSSYLNLFDLKNERARQGLQDQFTQAGGASVLPEQFATASSNLERGLAADTSGSLVDLNSRFFAPQVGAQSQNLSSYLAFISKLLG